MRLLHPVDGRLRQRDRGAMVDRVRAVGIEVSDRVVGQRGEVHDRVEPIEVAHRYPRRERPYGSSGHGWARGPRRSRPSLVEVVVEAGDVVARLDEQRDQDRSDVAVVSGERRRGRSRRPRRRDSTRRSRGAADRRSRRCVPGSRRGRRAACARVPASAPSTGPIPCHTRMPAASSRSSSPGSSGCWARTAFAPIARNSPTIAFSFPGVSASPCPRASSWMLAPCTCRRRCPSQCTPARRARRTSTQLPHAAE